MASLYREFNWTVRPWRIWLLKNLKPSHNWSKSQSLPRSSEGWIRRLKKPSEDWALVEGAKSIEAALAGWAQPLCLVRSKKSRWNSDVFPQNYLLEDHVLGRLSKVVTPQGVMGIFDVSAAPEWKSLLLAKKGPLMFLVGVQDPGNVGLAIRTAAGLGAAGVLSDGQSASPFSAKTIRASAGYALVLPCARAGDAEEVMRCAGEADFMRVGALCGEKEGDTSQAPSKKSALFLVLGSEGSGLSPKIQAFCDKFWSIPMSAGVESLNVAVAGALLLDRWRKGMVLESTHA